MNRIIYNCRAKTWLTANHSPVIRNDSYSTDGLGLISLLDLVLRSRLAYLFFLHMSFDDEDLIVLAINDKIQILKIFHPSLPNDARILLNTTRKAHLIEISDGEFKYFGISEGVKKNL